MWRKRPAKTHPLVWRHRSGRQVARARRDRVDTSRGWSAAEGGALLADLLGAVHVTERVYRHEWAVGDMVIWDNRGVLHRAARTTRRRRATCTAPPSPATRPCSERPTRRERRASRRSRPRSGATTSAPVSPRCAPPAPRRSYAGRRADPRVSTCSARWRRTPRSCRRTTRSTATSCTRTRSTRGSASCSS